VHVQDKHSRLLPEAATLSLIPQPINGVLHERAQQQLRIALYSVHVRSAAASPAATGVTRTHPKRYKAILRPANNTAQPGALHGQEVPRSINVGTVKLRGQTHTQNTHAL
jgi:hypothetical protein